MAAVKVQDARSSMYLLDKKSFSAASLDYFQVLLLVLLKSLRYSDSFHVPSSILTSGWLMLPLYRQQFTHHCRKDTIVCWDIRASKFYRVLNRAQLDQEMV